MAVRRRTWRTSTGEHREAWVVDYTARDGTRHIETFARRRDADARQAAIMVDLAAGTHTPISKSPTIAEAAELWLAACKRNGLERTTIKTYREHLAHILPLLSSVRLAELTAPGVRAFIDQLHRDGHSPAMIEKITVRLGWIVGDALERGLVAQNVVRSRRRRSLRQADARARGKLKVGVDIPTPAEISAFIGALRGCYRPLLLTAVFTGLRASELRGLRWADVDLKRGELHVRQRADRFNVMGRPKSAAGERTVPLPPILLNTLKEHRLASQHDLVFASRRGNVLGLSNIVKYGLKPAWIAAGVVKDGKAKYTGLHSLRHFFASWCINRRVDGGLELPLKVVSARMGHASISITADTYGHLFPRGDDGSELAAAERALLAVRDTGEA
jgi:integrase